MNYMQVKLKLNNPVNKRLVSEFFEYRIIFLDTQLFCLDNIEDNRWLLFVMGVLVVSAIEESEG